MNYITKLLTLQNQLRVFHWQSESYAEHKALGKAYEQLDELIDTFIEEFQGAYARIISKDKFVVELLNLEDSDIMDFVDLNINYLANELPKGLKPIDTNLLNVRDEMIGALQRLKYLLTLK